MKFIKKIIFPIAILLIQQNSFCQLYPVSFNEKISQSSLIVEGKVVKQYSFWNKEHTTIFTSNTLQVYKLFKGASVSKQIEVLTQGGTVDNYAVVVSDLLQMNVGHTGIFTLHLQKSYITNPQTKKILFDVYSSSQGFFDYDIETKEAWCPFAHYKIEELYNLIQQKTGQSYKVIDASFNINAIASNAAPPGVNAVISSFSPSSVHGGALNDPANNTLKITGSGFGATPAGKCGVEFKNGNNDNPNPDKDSKISYTSPYILDWSDNSITVSVPDFAATGLFAVVLADGTEIKSSSKLTVFFSVLNAEFLISGNNLEKEPRLMNTNGANGYSFFFSTNTAGKGIDLSSDPAKQTAQRAASTWKEITGANLAEGGNTNIQKVDPFDGTNILVYDNQNTGIPPLAAGVLESTSSGFSMCSNKSFTAQKTGFDILIRNPGVSIGNVIINDGPCFPPVGEYDLELIILHEFGHALNLAHINDDYEKTNSDPQTINPAKVMHYSVLDFTNRRSPDASALQGVLYTITPQNNTYGNCGLFNGEMQPLPVTPINNDECSGTFTPLGDAGTQVVFDLIHATSDKLTDPSFEQVNCQNKGTFVTNNAFFSFETNDSAVQSLQMKITGYTTAPAELSTCTGQGVRFAIYDAANCAAGQAWPQPIACGSFTGNGDLSPITGLLSNHKYILYFDGLRNTKAIFNASFNRSDATGGNNTVSIYPNPVSDKVNIKFFNTSDSKYQYALYDVVGKLIRTETLSVSPVSFLFNINMASLASGTYYMRIVNDKGESVIKQKLLKISH